MAMNFWKTSHTFLFRWSHLLPLKDIVPNRIELFIRIAIKDFSQRRFAGFAEDGHLCTRLELHGFSHPADVIVVSQAIGDVEEVWAWRFEGADGFVIDDAVAGDTLKPPISPNQFLSYSR